MGLSEAIVVNPLSRYRAGMGDPGIQDPLQMAKDDHQSVVDFAQHLICIPSRAGIDPYDPLFAELSRWLDSRTLPSRFVVGENGDRVALLCDVVKNPGPHYVFNACIDTAPFGDEGAWNESPTSGLIRGDWLYGRGSADSKIAVSVFLHLAARLAARPSALRGSVSVLLDADEHTGRFGGAKSYFGESERSKNVAGVLIGYPGLDQVVVGSRGFFRAELTLYGMGSHSGGSTETTNAIEKAADLIRDLGNGLPCPVEEGFPKGPRLTVTSVRGGSGFSTVPDKCQLNVDVRLTPLFDAAAAQAFLKERVSALDERWTNARTKVRVVESWPAYQLPGDSPLPRAVISAARRYGVDVQPKIAGPSNIGNYLACLGIDATAGFGVRYRGLHGPNEAIFVEDVLLVQAIYHQAILTLLST